MKRIVILASIVLWAAPLPAETYSWIDDNGTYNFTEDFSKVPKKYRKSVGKRGDMDSQPSPSRAAEPVPNIKPVTPAASADTKGSSGKDAGGGKKDKADNDLYDGKKPEVWQQDFRARAAEYKRLEQQLVQIESLIKNPRGISKERFDGLSQEFKETQKQYNAALKFYNELNDAANKAGLPAEFRK
ncbi:MAG: hypothetical protein JJE30_15190 [Desulfuromonadales bacterium]|nr:hypothetical protein [Desulfuromonadales bacterium]